MTLRIAYLSKIITAVLEWPLTTEERQELSLILANLMGDTFHTDRFLAIEDANQVIDQALRAERDVV